MIFLGPIRELRLQKKNVSPKSGETGPSGGAQLISLLRAEGTGTSKTIRDTNAVILTND